jgi:hypothetical protein
VSTVHRLRDEVPPMHEVDTTCSLAPATGRGTGPADDGAPEDVMRFRGMLALLALVPATVTGCGGGAGEDDGAGGEASVGSGGAVPGGEDVAACASSPVPELETWEERMIGWEAQMHCDALLGVPDVGAADLEPFIARTDYDAIRVFTQIAGYTGDPMWSECAARATTVYRDRFVLPEEGSVVAYWNHSAGLALEALQGDAASAEAVRLLARNGDYCSDESDASTEDPVYSRENANCLFALVDAERLGEPRRERLGELYQNAYGHIDQWFVSRSYGYYEPFMFALTAESLIHYYEHIDGDREVVDAIVIGLDTIWDEAWDAQQGSFRYSTEEQADEDGKDLNLLIAPVFAWAYERTCDPRFKERGDAVFASGVKSAFLGDEETGEGAKQFNQNYRWSFDYVRLRKGDP